MRALLQASEPPRFRDRLEDDPTVTTADSETIMSYEIGYKALLDKARFNVAAFYYAVDDMQLTAVGGTNNSTALLNANEGIGYGVEFEIDYVVTEKLRDFGRLWLQQNGNQ